MNGCASMNFDKSDPICLMLLFFVWVAAALAVNPVGDFPLNDDWAYGSAVRALLEEGDIRLSDWTATNLIAQVLWGALFCLPFGFSFTALRASTLVLGLVGVVATYGLLREARAQAWLALLGALVLAFSPIYFSLSFTFMSDVPFTSIATASSWLLLRALRRDSRLEIAGGLFLAAAAILIRQVGLALPLAFAPAYIVRYGFSVRRLLKAMLPITAGFVLQIGFEGWLRWSDRIPAAFGRQINTIQMLLHPVWPSLLGDAATITWYAVVYTGFFLFPFLVATQRSAPCRGSRISIALLGIATAATVVLFIYGKLMPLHVNILRTGGLGCCDQDPSLAPRYFWVLVTFVGILGALLLVVELVKSALRLVSLQTDCGERYVLTFALAITFIAFAPLPLIKGFYDRYLIVFLPWLMLAMVARNLTNKDARPSRWAVIVGAFAFVSSSVFTVAATHDYLSANRIRWAALNKLLIEYRVKPERINGGFEFSGLYLYDSPYGPPPGAAPRPVSDDYVVSYFARANYAILETRNVPRWLPWGRGNIIIQSKINSTH
jgi:4-amino-4-deoxy-L-arabinose transferase-like glycosyltransferase